MRTQAQQAAKAHLHASITLHMRLTRLWRDPANRLRGQYGHMAGNINAVAEQYRVAHAL